MRSTKRSQVDLEETMTDIDRIRGALFGVAVGDALGAPVEFMSADDIARKHGRVTTMLGGGWLNVEPGEVTDDTQMSLCVAEGIVAMPLAPVEEVGLRFIDWYNTKPKDIGRTCQSSIRNAMNNSKKSGKPADKSAWFAAARSTDNSLGGLSAGNGALMRTVYTGLYYGERHEAATVDIAKMTHWNEESNAACVLYSNLIAQFTEGAGINATSDLLKNTRYSGDIQNHAPTGYVVDSMCCALDSLLRTNSFEDAVVAAVNLGGDADTIGAITGGLAGALYGYEAIPGKWLETLEVDVVEKLMRLADVAYQNRGGVVS